MAMEEIMVRSRPSSSCAPANRLARSTSLAMSIVSSTGELNRLISGAKP
jgi:hypothetical protein